MTKESLFITSYRHVYDVDAFEILDILKEKYKSNKNKISLESLKFEEDNLLKFLIDEGFNANEKQKNRNFILPSNYNLYNTYLGYKLLIIDVYKIEPFLSYQSVLFLGNHYANKDNFFGLVEFLIYDFLKERLEASEQIRLEKIVNWLERNRDFLTKKAYNELETGNTLVEISKKTNKSNNDNSTKRTITMEPQFADVFYQRFKSFFIEQEQQLYRLLIKNEDTELLRFNGNTNQLVELFKRLRYNSKIKVSTYKKLAEWIINHFTVKNKQNEFVKIKINTAIQVLSKPTAEPKKENRIMEDVAEYKVPNQR
jgi:hypothetical protein